LFISAYADGAIEAIGDLTPGVGFLQKPSRTETIFCSTHVHRTAFFIKNLINLHLCFKTVSNPVDIIISGGGNERLLPADNRLPASRLNRK
jgi:hypothetical protein